METCMEMSDHQFSSSQQCLDLFSRSNKFDNNTFFFLNHSHSHIHTNWKICFWVLVPIGLVIDGCLIRYYLWFFLRQIFWLELTQASRIEDKQCAEWRRASLWLRGVRWRLQQHWLAEHTQHARRNERGHHCWGRNCFPPPPPPLPAFSLGDNLGGGGDTCIFNRVDWNV